MPCFYYANSNISEKQKEVKENTAILQRHKGRALCMDLLLCYFANKPFSFDPFTVQEEIVTGIVNKQKILHLLASGYFTLVEWNNSGEIRTVADALLQREYKGIILKYYHPIKSFGEEKIYLRNGEI